MTTLSHTFLAIAPDALHQQRQILRNLHPNEALRTDLVMGNGPQRRMWITGLDGDPGIVLPITGTKVKAAPK
jgi:hypothetical protein